MHDRTILSINRPPMIYSDVVEARTYAYNMPEKPTTNDMTYAQLCKYWERCARGDKRRMRTLR